MTLSEGAANFGNAPVRAPPAWLRAASACVRVVVAAPRLTPLPPSPPSLLPPPQVSLRSLFAGKRGILFAVPGAYTPTCSKAHLPSYVKESAQLKALGVDLVCCVATNDAWVMHAWGEQAGAVGKVRMLADADGALTKALGQEKVSGVLTRSKRYSMVVVDNTIAAFNEESAGGAECTMAGALIASLPAVLAKAPLDPMEAFCASEPSADECRVYSD